ncbi:hypothetical protein TNCV_4577941 [Trichonephila clavipes]|nr:hypothetical protein TNCV_4577941 [Trichonephila clavipes]
MLEKFELCVQPNGIGLSSETNADSNWALITIVEAKPLPDIIKNKIHITSDSRPEGLGSMPDATKYPLEIVEVEIDGVAIYRPFNEFRRSKSYCHLYAAQVQRQAFF